MPNKTTDIKNKCLNCHEELHKATGIDHDRIPHKDAISICSNCGHIMAFDDHLQFRELTDEEVTEIAGNKELLAAQKIGGLIKFEQDLEKEILPIFKKAMEKMEIQTRQERMSDNEDIYGWFARDGNDHNTEIGFGDTQEEAVKDMLTLTLTRLVNAAYKRQKRN